MNELIDKLFRKDRKATGAVVSRTNGKLPAGIYEVTGFQAEWAPGKTYEPFRISVDSHSKVDVTQFTVPLNTQHFPDSVKFQKLF